MISNVVPLSCRVMSCHDSLQSTGLIPAMLPIAVFSCEAKHVIGELIYSGYTKPE